MFIRRTQTRNRTSGEPYATHRLVQISVINQFDGPPIKLGDGR